MNAALAVVIALIALTLVKATPLIFAALGGVLSERSGVINIGLEAIMIAGAFTAVVVSGATGSPIIGVLGGIIAGALVAAVLAFAATRLAVDQIVAGTGLNIATLAAAAFGLVLVYHQPGASHEVPALGRGGQTALTIVAFLSPSFWIYGLFALILLYWAAAQDENPLALYVLVTFAIPGASFYIPGFIVNQLFDLTQYRILSLVIVIPSIVRHWNNPAHSTGRGLKPGKTKPEHEAVRALLAATGRGQPS